MSNKENGGTQVMTIKDARHFLQRDDVMEQIQMAVAKTIDPDRLIRVALTAMSRNPGLLECTPASWVLALQEAGSLGLEPTGVLGHAYLVPRWNKHVRGNEAQFQVGYRGLVELARRSGKVFDVSSEVVREGDHFDYAKGLDPRLEHLPDPDAAGEVTHVYAIAFFTNGFKKFEVMTRAQVEKIRALSPAAKSGPWVDHWDAMAKKTVVRQLSKELPLSAVDQAVIAYDEAVDLTKSRVDIRRFLAGEDTPEPEDEATRVAEANAQRLQALKQRVASREEAPEGVDPDTGEIQEAEYEVEEGDPEPEPEPKKAKATKKAEPQDEPAEAPEQGGELPV